MAQHAYRVFVEWTGNRGAGTTHYRAYGRDHTVRCEQGKQLEGSADKTFHGDAERWNPEELVLAALTQCHMLSYLHAAATAGVNVVAYDDAASATLSQEGTGGRFIEAVLRPHVTIASHDSALAASLHEVAARNCFIAASVNFPVRHEPTTTIAVDGGAGNQRAD